MQYIQESIKEFACKIIIAYHINILGICVLMRKFICGKSTLQNIF